MTANSRRLNAALLAAHDFGRFACVVDVGGGQGAFLHDWEDEKAIAIPKACRRAMSPDGRLLVIERPLVGPNQGAEAKFSDLNRLVGPGGRERTEEEYAQLFRRGGFALAAVTPPGRGEGDRGHAGVGAGRFELSRDRGVYLNPV